MEKREMTKIFAYLGFVLIVASLAIGSWIGIENKNIYDRGPFEEESMDAKNRTAFFYDQSQASIGGVEETYFFNSVPSFSGFNFFILMAGITFLLFSFYYSVSTGERNTENLAKLGILIMVISLILAAWVSYTNMELTKKESKIIPDFSDIFDKESSIAIVEYLNAALVYFAPAILIFAIWKEMDKTKEDLYNYLMMLGFLLLAASLILGIISGIYAKKAVDAVNKATPDFEGASDAVETKGFISAFFPYVGYLGLGFVLFAFIHFYLKERFILTDLARRRLTAVSYVSILLLIVAVLLGAFISAKYHAVASDLIFLEESYKDVEKYLEDTAYYNYATSLVLLGFGLMLFSVSLGHYFETGEFSKFQIMNLGFFIFLLVGLIFGLYVGFVKSGKIEPENFDMYFMVEYLYVVILFTAAGFMLFSWTQNIELISGIRFLCPDCGTEVQFIPYYKSWYCETCEELLSEPIKKEVRICPDCHVELDYIEMYNSWYCPSCEEYKLVKKRKKKVPKGVSVYLPRQRAKMSQKAPKCRICKGEMVFIPQYGRWYCYTCQRYGGVSPQAPKAKEKKAKMFKCPGCGKVAEIKTDKRPLKLKCSTCGKITVLKK